MNNADYENNKRICRDLRKILSDTLYTPQPPNEYTRMLSSMLQQLHSIQGAFRKEKTNIPFKTLSKKQMAVVDKAIVKYKKWLTKDSDDANFISNKNEQMRKLNSLLSICDQFDSNRKIIFSMINQLEKRKLLLTNKQKLLCNKIFKEIKNTG